jgi:hypothetical protein
MRNVEGRLTRSDLPFLLERTRRFKSVLPVALLGLVSVLGGKKFGAGTDFVEKGGPTDGMTDVRKKKKGFR